MGLFKSRQSTPAPMAVQTNTSAFAEMALNYITDGVLLIDGNGVVKYANPAAANMAGYGTPTNMLGLDYQIVLKLETTEGVPVADNQSKLSQAIATNEPLTTRDYLLISAQSERKGAISLTLTPTGGPRADKIITFRDITKELEEESEQSEFISTASHEMRTPVASIEGYLGLALNPQTATIDERARKYLTEAHNASQHLGHLFKDLLDVTKLDDGRLRVHLVPVEIVALVQQIAASRQKDMVAKHLKYSFGTADVVNETKKVNPLVYAAVDVDSLREILDNLIENAIKYTPEGGEIWVNCRGDGDKVLINVSDSGIGVSPEDANHIFQKFYRVDNSQTRSVGGTGLGLYIVKQRVEAMNGRVWVESAFGDGSTFFVSLPRLTDAEYRKRLIAYQNEQAVQNFAKPNPAMAVTSPVAPIATATVGTAATPSVAPSAAATAAPVVPAPGVSASTASAPAPAVPVVSSTSTQAAVGTAIPTPTALTTPAQTAVPSDSATNSQVITHVNSPANITAESNTTSTPDTLAAGPIADMMKNAQIAKTLAESSATTSEDQVQEEPEASEEPVTQATEAPNVLAAQTPDVALNIQASETPPVEATSPNIQLTQSINQGANQ